MRSPGSQFETINCCCFESCSKGSRSLDARSPKNLPERVTSYLARAQHDLSIACIQNKHFAAIANLPALYTLRGCNVLRQVQPFVGYVILRVGFNCEVRTARHYQGNRTITGPC